VLCPLRPCARPECARQVPAEQRRQRGRWAQGQGQRRARGPWESLDPALPEHQRLAEASSVAMHGGTNSKCHCSRGPLHLLPFPSWGPPQFHLQPQSSQGLLLGTGPECALQYSPGPGLRLMQRLGCSEVQPWTPGAPHAESFPWRPRLAAWSANSWARSSQAGRSVADPCAGRSVADPCAGRSVGGPRAHRRLEALLRLLLLLLLDAPQAPWEGLCAPRAAGRGGSGHAPQEALNPGPSLLSREGRGPPRGSLDPPTCARAQGCLPRGPSPCMNSQHGARTALCMQSRAP